MKTPYYYTDVVDKARQLIRFRDQNTCQECQRRWSEGERKFDVHHLDEQMIGRSNDLGIHKYDLQNPDKLVTLCHKCHIAHHKGKPLTFDRSVLKRPLLSYQQIAMLTPPSPLVQYVKVDMHHLLRNNKYMKLEPKKPVSVWLRPNEKKTLQRLAKKHKLSNSELLGRLITQANAKS